MNRAKGRVNPSTVVARDSDPVNHPAHYNKLPACCQGCGRRIECIDVIEWMTLNLGAVVKYVWRSGEKGKLIEDLNKARWYLDREIQRLTRLGQVVDK
jgi:hypothetical protein